MWKMARHQFASNRRPALRRRLTGYIGFRGKGMLS